MLCPRLCPASCLSAGPFALRPQIVHFSYIRVSPSYVTGCFRAIGVPVVLVHVLMAVSTLYSCIYQTKTTSLSRVSGPTPAHALDLFA